MLLQVESNLLTNGNIVSTTTDKPTHRAKHTLKLLLSTVQAHTFCNYKNLN
jgi:hypothetical protein